MEGQLWFFLIIIREHKENKENKERKIIGIYLLSINTHAEKSSIHDEYNKGKLTSNLFSPI
jgi:hypothetical protein